MYLYLYLLLLHFSFVRLMMAANGLKVQIHRRKLDWIASLLQIKTQADWYGITGSQVKKHGGAAVLNEYNDSLLTALKSVYPEYQWFGHLRSFVPSGFWQQPQNNRMLFDWYAEQLGIEHQADWYRVSGSDLNSLLPSSLLTRYGGDSLLKALRVVYPEFQWNPLQYTHILKKFWKQSNPREVLDWISETLGIETQQDWYHISKGHIKQIGCYAILNQHGRSLFKTLQSAYPEFQWNPFLCKYASKTKYTNKRKWLDSVASMWGIELQKDWYTFMESSMDDFKTRSAVRMLRKYYPEFIWKYPKRRDAPHLMLAHYWTEDIDPTGWWISEKYDGSRTLWDGRHFISRRGQKWNVPSWFKQGLPTNMTLDGEMWGGRNTFEATSAVLKRRGAINEHLWTNIKFKVFDAPSLRDLPFEQRQLKIEEHFSKNSAKHVEVVKQEKCNGVEHLKEKLKEVEALGGEGLMLRSPNSLYEPKRSHNMLKVKRSIQSEAKVIGYKHSEFYRGNRLIGLICELPNGKTFTIGRGLSEDVQLNPPQIGTWISFRQYLHFIEGLSSD